MTATGDATDRLDTRWALRPLPALPTGICFAGDLRGDLNGDLWGDFLGEKLTDALAGLLGETGTGVGGSSASICSTCQERFSSRNLKRSAYEHK